MQDQALESHREIFNPPSRTVEVDISSDDFNIAVPLCGACTCVYVGTGGDVVTQSRDDPADSWRTRKNVPAGTYLVGRFIKIRKEGTTAADMIAESV